MYTIETNYRVIRNIITGNNHDCDNCQKCEELLMKINFPDYNQHPDILSMLLERHLKSRHGKQYYVAVLDSKYHVPVSYKLLTWRAKYYFEESQELT